jgi:hypothetical protein
MSIVIANSRRGGDLLNQLLKLGRIELVEVPSRLAIRGNPRIIKWRIHDSRAKETDLEEIEGIEL